MLASALLVAAGVRAESPSPTLTDLGGASLLTAPSARMDEAGTLVAGVTWTPLYRHGFVTLQALPSLEVTLRQSAEFTGSLAPARMSGGIDVKFRLIPEGPLHPQIAVGMRGLFGRSMSWPAGAGTISMSPWGSAGNGWASSPGWNTVPRCPACR